MRRIGVAMLSRLPLGLASVLCWVIAWTWWAILPIRRREAVERLREALPDVAPGPTLRRMFHDICLGYVEILQLDRVEVVVEGPTDVTGSLLLSGHGGSWDLALLKWGDTFPMAIFLRTPKDPWARDFIAAQRAAHRVRALETGATMKDAYAALDEGLNVMFIQDQRFNDGLLSPFFGRPAKTSAGLAAAARKSGRPVYGCWQWREGVGRHRLKIELLSPPPEPTIQAWTDLANRWYEAQIRARPHGWLWLHRRWKNAG